MFCTNCGFENPALHRFCGMCGTPLPQRPITAPGAQSTLSYTRVPVEGAQPVSSSSATHSGSVAPAAIEAPEAQPSSAEGANNYFSQAEQAESLEQFIAGFRYTPPSEDEVTMTGDKPVLDAGTKYVPPTPVSLSDEQIPVAEPPAKVEEPLSPQALPVEQAPPMETVTTEPPPFATKGFREQAPERSRFLDFAEPPKEELPPDPAPSISGPSFLGLSETPIAPHLEPDFDTPRQSHWRAWAAAIVILIFAGLAILEWRAEKQQSDNSPIGIMKMQIERLKGKKNAVVTPAPSSEATPASPAPSSNPQPGGSSPEMQVAPQQKPQTTTPEPDSNHKATPENPANPGAASNAPAQSPATGKSTASGDEAMSAQEQSADTPAQEAEGAVKTTPGAEELAKAANASDSAAASAWLWKAVAKGNSEAPIRLANLYIKGDGVPQSCEQAMILLRSAAAKENAAARSRLGSLYATGTCVPRNRVRAYEYVSEAVEANPKATSARHFKQQLWAQMTPREREQVQKVR